MLLILGFSFLQTVSIFQTVTEVLDYFTKILTFSCSFLDEKSSQILCFIVVSPKGRHDLLRVCGIS